MWLREPLDDILSSRAKVGVLRVVLGSGVPLSGREIARRAGIDPGHASRVLRELVASGVLVSRDMGAVAAYEPARSDGPLAQGLADLFAAETQRYDEAVAELTAGIPRIVSVVLFGSEARREATAGSDTDVLIVVEKRSNRVEDALDEACLRIAEKHGLALSWHVADLAELRRWDRADSVFLAQLLAEGVCLAGRPLEELQREWRRGKSA